MSKKPNNKMPFSQKLFYLDVTTNLTLKSKIEYCIKQLGGTVETFLDRKVRYVVTDKPMKDWPVTNKNSSSSNNKSTAGSKQSQDPTVHQVKRQATSTSNVKKNNDTMITVPKLEFMGLTRGKLLATTTKTPQSLSNKTKDVLETAVKLDVKILTHNSILDFCRNYIKVPLDDVSHEQSNDTTENITTTATTIAKVKVKQLKSPFLKFEDKEERFAPVYKEFETWPSVCVDTSSNSQQITTTNNTNHHPNQTINNNNNTTNHNHQDNNQIKSKQMVTNNQTPTVPKNFSAKLIQPIAKKRQRVFFCEICSKEFTNMIEHVQTDQHQEYMKNEDNYKDLRSVIDSLPNWITLNDTSAFDENDEFTDEESEFEDEFSDDYDEDAYSSESKETAISEEEMNQKVNSDNIVLPSFVTPVKMFELANIFNNINE